LGETFQEESPKNDFARAGGAAGVESIDGRKQQKDFLRSQSAARFAIPAR